MDVIDEPGGRAREYSHLAINHCTRCDAACTVDPKPGSQARILRRSRTPEGLCVNCAVHDQLRHLYPANLILAGSGPAGLALPHIQRQFYAIARSVGTDAEFDEIDWQRIIDNWDMPFPTKLKQTAMNPVTQDELDREPEERARRRARAMSMRTKQEIIADHQIEEEEILSLLRKGAKENEREKTNPQKNNVCADQ